MNIAPPPPGGGPNFNGNMNLLSLSPQQLFDYVQAHLEKLLNEQVRYYSNSRIFDPLDNFNYH
jgi:hypothetical protein